MLEALAELSAAGLVGQIPEPGGYMAAWKIVVMLIFITPWLAICPWVPKDAEYVRSPKTMWSAMVVGLGALGVLMWLLIPIYVVGMLAYVLLAAGGLMAYALHRNAKVPAEERVLTGEHLSSIFSGGSKGKQARQPEVTSYVRLYSSTGHPVHPPQDVPPDDPAVSAYNLAQDFLFNIAWRRASQAELLPTGSDTRMRLTIDGVVNEHGSISPGEGEGLIQFIKTIAGMDPEDRRRPQEGKIAVDYQNEHLEIDTSSAGTTSGQRMKLRVAGEVVQTRLDELGMADDVRNRLAELSEAGSGVIICSGRPGSGVTSTLYSLLRAQDAFIKQLVTLEAKKEVDLENVTQNTYAQAGEQAGKLASMIRRDPDVVMVDRPRDEKAAQTILEGAEEKFFLVGMPASDTFSALAKWVKVSGGTEAVKPLRAVTCQMLVRKLCPDCKEAYRPDPQMLAKANIPAQKVSQFYRPRTTPMTDEKGNPITCMTCQGSGYVGRTAVFEMLEVTDELSQLIQSGASLSQIKAAARKNKMLYLQEQALRKVIQGETSIQEVLRVQQESKSK